MSNNNLQSSISLDSLNIRVMYQNRELERRRRAAIAYLGDKWIYFKNLRKEELVRV